MARSTGFAGEDVERDIRRAGASGPRTPPSSGRWRERGPGSPRHPRPELGPSLPSPFSRHRGVHALQKIGRLGHGAGDRQGAPAPCLPVAKQAGAGGGSRAQVHGFESPDPLPDRLDRAFQPCAWTSPALHPRNEAASGLFAPRPQPGPRVEGDAEAGHLPPERRRGDGQELGGLLAAAVALAERRLDGPALGRVDDVGERAARPRRVAGGGEVGARRSSAVMTPL